MCTGSFQNPVCLSVVFIVSFVSNFARYQFVVLFVCKVSKLIENKRKIHTYQIHCTVHTLNSRVITTYGMCDRDRVRVRENVHLSYLSLQTDAFQKGAAVLHHTQSKHYGKSWINRPRKVRSAPAVVPVAHFQYVLTPFLSCCFEYQWVFLPMLEFFVQILQHERHAMSKFKPK